MPEAIEKKLTRTYSPEELLDIKEQVIQDLPPSSSFFLGGSAGLGLEAADVDFFVSVEDNLSFAENHLELAGYTGKGFSQYVDCDFATFRKGDINIILIADPESYTARMRAFEICKYLTHIMGVVPSKENRKMIHKIAAGEATYVSQ